MAFYIFPQAVPKEECEKYVDFCTNNIELEDASTIKAGWTDIGPDTEEKLKSVRKEGSNFNYDTRKTSIGFLTDLNNPINEVVWGYLREANKQYFKYRLEYFQAIQFAKYQNGGHYDWHQDSTTDGNVSECRKLSLTMSLTDHNEYDGGLLQFYNGDKPYNNKDHDIERDIKSQGTVIVFDSRDWHRVTPVTEGIRHSIVCWTVGPKFV